MVIKRFYADGFRNIENCSIEFKPGVNLLYGNNAQGKTNVVEGIYVFARGRSFRAREDKELLGFGKEGFRMGIEYVSEDGDGTLEYAHFGKERKRRKNGYAVRGAKDMIGSFRAVLFYPDDLSIVKESPEERRAFLNVAIGQIDKIYVDSYARYKSALENRNCLLKSASKGSYYDRGELESWSEIMAGYAADIYITRKKYIKKLELYANRAVSDISGGKEMLSLLYESNLDYDGDDKKEIIDLYREVFTKELDKECIVGTSLYGPHRDDMEIKVNGISARSYASQGQQRSIVLALKIAEGDVCHEVTGEYPVYLFDDVLSELDDMRKSYVLSRLGEKQIIITSCDEESLKGHADRIISVENGKYVTLS